VNLYVPFTYGRIQIFYICSATVWYVYGLRFYTIHGINVNVRFVWCFYTSCDYKSPVYGPNQPDKCHHKSMNDTRPFTHECHHTRTTCVCVCVCFMCVCLCMCVYMCVCGTRPFTHECHHTRTTCVCVFVCVFYVCVCVCVAHIQLLTISLHKNNRLTSIYSQMSSYKYEQHTYIHISGIRWSPLPVIYLNKYHLASTNDTHIYMLDLRSGGPHFRWLT